MNSPLHDRLIALLNENGVAYRLVTHPPTPTSADSARARGEPLGCGAKALVVKADGQFRLLVIPADRKLDSRAAKKSLGVRDLRFASPEELAATVGLPPGAIPPFGEPLLPLPLAADVDLGVRFPQVAFNAASLTASVVMAAVDWARLAQPQRAVLTLPEGCISELLPLANVAGGGDPGPASARPATRRQLGDAPTPE